LDWAKEKGTMRLALAKRDHAHGFIKEISIGTHQVGLRNYVGDNDYRDHGYGREQCKMEDVNVTAFVFQELHSITCVTGSGGKEV
jgi:hypothetical protein